MTDNWKVEQGDCRDIMRTLPDNSVDAIVSDPPYGLSFMGKEWDHGVPGVEFWTEALRVAKPGAHLVAFGGTRTYHRLAVAIEDAGWEVRDCLSWLYGSGFPKSLAVDKAIDKRGGYPHLAAQIGEALRMARESRGLTVGECDKRFCGGTTNWSWFEGRPKGQRAPTTQTFAAIAAEWPEVAHLAEAVAEAEREVVGRDTKARSTAGASALPTMGGSVEYKSWDITAPATDAAKRWHGWGTALKPAWEPIILARKPLTGTVAANVTQYGTGAINVDGCRIGTDTVRSSGTTGMDARRFAQGTRPQDYEARQEPSLHTGRWPANVLLDEDAAGMLDAQSGERKPATSRSGAGWRSKYVGGQKQAEVQTDVYNDTGGASRFFYTAKVSRREREAGLDGMPERISAKSNGAQAADDRGEMYDPNTVGLNRTVRTTNHHPTVKPIALMRWLCRLVTPPNGLILDPFNGSGSTGCAAVLEGFRYLGCELEAEYVEIARRRIAYWQTQRAEPDLFG
jgi:DNA modification methylase